MSRRTQRRVDPSIDLSPWLLGVDDLPRPWDAERLYGRTAPLEVELGSGKGLFMASSAAAYPETNFLGLEVSRKFAELAAERLRKRELTNARIVHGDGLRVFSEVLSAASLRAVHVYFPDPWWKARHKKRRVINARFLADVMRTLAPGGTLHFWTDVEEYYQTSLELIAAETPLAGPFEVPELAPQHDLDYCTHFERRMRLHGEAVYRAEFRKRESSPT